LRQVAHVLFGNLQAIAIPHDGFEDKTDGHRQFGNGAESRFFQCGQRVIKALMAIAEVEFLKRVEQIVRTIHKIDGARRRPNAGTRK
jgi:hypothetical protein